MEDRIFRQYDIRGIFGKDLTLDMAERIGRGYAKYISQRRPSPQRLKVSIGNDVRLSSHPLKEALIRGIASSGVDVVDIGDCPTPLQYFSLYHLNLDGGIMITGSHNPPEYNGFKVSVGRETIYGDAIQDLRRIVEEQGQGTGEGDAQGQVEQYEIIPAYVHHLVDHFSDSMLKEQDSVPVKVVIDGGNGTAGLVMPELLKKLGYEVVELYTTPDGHFPNHHPDPTVEENLRDLIATVKEEGADLGIAYDGDADRIGVVDENGSIIWGDQLMIIFAGDILRQRGEGATFVGEVKCSQVMFDEIERLGGRAVMWKTGHSLIKAKMKEVGAMLAGEMSGHIFFADRYFGYDDALYATCRLLEILSHEKLRGRERSLSALLADIPKTFSTPEIRIDCPDEEKFVIIERLSSVLAEGENELPIKDIITIDGLRIIFEDGWALIRASNTQPVLVTRFEASTKEMLERIKVFVEGCLERSIARVRETVGGDRR
jgi:phosphomannomutase/phosphoglucomutase